MVKGFRGGDWERFWQVAPGCTSVVERALSHYGSSRVIGGSHTAHIYEDLRADLLGSSDIIWKNLLA